MSWLKDFWLEMRLVKPSSDHVNRINLFTLYILVYIRCSIGLWLFIFIYTNNKTTDDKLL